MSILHIRRRSIIFCLAYLSIVAGIIYLAFSHWGYDDPYITYRYAQNILSGRGFVYNPGERLLSTTTPLFTLLLASAGIFWSDLPHIAIGVGALALALGAVFIWDLAHAWDAPVLAWTGLALYPFFPLLLSTLGSETPLYLAFCLGGFACYARQRQAWAAILVALAVLTRPDGVLVAFVLAIDWSFIKRQPIPWRNVAIFLVIILPWFIFAWGYFGSPVPVTLVAKQSQGRMAISQGFASGFITLLASYGRRWFYWVEASLALLGLVFVARSGRRWLLILSWSALYFAAYSLLGVTRYFWYYAPLVPGLVVLAGLGITQLGRIAAHPRLIPSFRHAPRILVVALIGFFFVGEGTFFWRLRQQPDARLQIYRAVGEWLRDQTPGTAQVGTLEAGIIGYYSDRPMVDFSGLIQPDVARQMNQNSTYDDAAVWAVTQYHPNYLVLHQGVFPRLEEGFASRQCQLVKTFEGAQYGYSSNLDIYRCR